jgi:VIT family
MGFSAVVANAVSLGTGEYLSSLAQREFMQVERRRETWQLKHFKEAEIKEVRLFEKMNKLLFIFYRQSQSLRSNLCLFKFR